MDFKKYKDTVYQIIGAAMEVHDVMNWGLLEPVYNEALHLELLDRGIDNEREKELPCFYKHHEMEKFYKMDIVVGDVVVELKSVEELNSAHRAQLFNYLRLTKKRATATTRNLTSVSCLTRTCVLSTTKN